MTLKQLIKLEDKAKEVWVVSSSLHYDVENSDFSEIVSVNMGQKTKYRYVVPASKQIEKNIKLYKKKYGLSATEIANNFLLLPDGEFTPFIMEIAIYNGNSDAPIACAAPALEDSNDVIQFNKETTKNMVNAFKELWKRYKHSKP